MDRTPATRTAALAFLRALGPAIIVASVVLGPGSILTSSKVGAAYGFGMVWVPIMAAVLMMAFVALGARLGVVLDGSLCDELAQRVGRPFAVVIGLTVFGICAGFQFGNNLGVLSAIEPLLGASSSAAGGLGAAPSIMLVLLNGAIITFLYGSKRLYRPVEVMMMVLVGLMILAFVGNLLFLLLLGPPAPAPMVVTKAAQPAAMLAVIGLIGTTFSVAGAFYQAYLVREKGWGIAEVKRGLIDSVAGITVLGTITLVIMATSALSLHRSGVAASQLTSVGEVARQLQPLFGRAALVLFCLGIFAGSFSSFLVNAIIGGTILADGLGLGSTMDGRATKAFTTLALLAGMLVAVFMPAADRVGLIIVAQALVVVAFPLLALSMLYLATRRDLTGARRVPGWLRVMGLVGLVVVLLSTYRVLTSLLSRF